MKKTMDPNPKKFPILSFVLSRFHPNPNPSSPSFDIEQPPLLQRASSSSTPSPRHASDVELMERMPRLNQPDLLASMAGAVADVAHTRSVLSTLGDRPDHEAVDDARSALARVDADLSGQLEGLFRAPRPDEVDAAQWRAELAGKENELRRKAEREKFAYKAVVQLDEMHEAYEKLLRDAEEKLVRIYGASVTAASVSDAGEKAEKEGDFGDHVDEEVVRILQGSGKNTERVDLSGRQLRFLPEVFGKFSNLLVLDLSNNQLQVIPDSIAGLEHLEELHASSNLMVSLPDSIGLLHSLKILNVSGNKLKTLPDSISSCRSLVELDVSFNELTYLPTNIGYELLNLQKIAVNLNKLRSLPSSVCEMRSLRHLDAHFNELHGLPSAFGKLTNLEFLNLSSNFSDMKVLPETFGDLINLKELDLSNNQIHVLPDTFGQLDNLVKLNLDQNPIIIPPVNVACQGADAVKEFMAKRLLHIVEEQKNRELQAEAESRAGWLTRSTSWLKNYASGVSGTVSEYLGPGDRDPYLDQQL